MKWLIYRGTSNSFIHFIVTSGHRVESTIACRSHRWPIWLFILGILHYLPYATGPLTVQLGPQLFPYWLCSESRKSSFSASLQTRLTHKQYILRESIIFSVKSRRINTLRLRLRDARGRVHKINTFRTGRCKILLNPYRSVIIDV